MEKALTYTGIGLAGGLLMLAFTWLVFQAMDREAAFNERIRETRCATGKYPTGYCKSYVLADVRGEK